MNIKSFFEEFIKVLEKDKEKLAYLQLIEKLETYLVKEFCFSLFKASEGQYFAITNLGNKGERKIDICVVEGEDLDDLKSLASYS